VTTLRLPTSPMGQIVGICPEGCFEQWFGQRRQSRTASISQGGEDALGEVVYLEPPGDYAGPCRKRSMMSATSLVNVSTALFASSRSGWIST
jgi:hypothetical protein